jgi:hypothetical protein
VSKKNFDWFFDGLFNEHERRGLMRDLVSKEPQDSRQQKQEAALQRIAEALGCTSEEALARVIGVGEAMAKCVSEGGRVVFVFADGKERQLRLIKTEKEK